ncbi:hypothetical protein GWI33_013113 [Rhynchophorus ferrugineus]|uniref:Uncharacterized protein n=1 Tax=Rhynchophorus ferrugineus TaxID=354439 RepID=A0A834I592_RHYFE|nr:hypothetical protein GWI33_013113 [Rhynchophorus ferrugineus]
MKITRISGRFEIRQRGDEAIPISRRRAPRRLITSPPPRGRQGQGRGSVTRSSTLLQLKKSLGEGEGEGEEKFFIMSPSCNGAVDNCFFVFGTGGLGQRRTLSVGNRCRRN